MLSSIIAFLKALAELFNFSKWVYNESKKTPAQKDDDIEERNQDQKKKLEQSGRPEWD